MSLKKDLIDKQARFWVLMAGGATLTAASETVGVCRATGRKWRQDRWSDPAQSPGPVGPVPVLGGATTDRRPVPGRGRRSGDRRWDRPLARDGQS